MERKRASIYVDWVNDFERVLKQAEVYRDEAAAFANKESIPVNVKAYGALGNGVSDDTAAIQNCINAVGAAGGGVIFFPPGTYQVTDAGGSTALSMEYANVLLRGAGQETTKIRAFGTPAHVLVLNSTGSGVEHLTIDGGANGDFSIGTHGIRVQGYNQKIRHLNITNCRAYGIGVGQGTGSTVQGLRIDDVRISNTGNDAIDTKNRTDSNFDIIYSRITASTWGQNPATTVQAGIDCRGPVKVTNVTLSPTGDQVGVRFREGEIGSPNGLGAHEAVLMGFHIVGSAATTSVGVYVAARNVSISSGTISGTFQGVDLIEGYARIVSVQARNCGQNGFRFRTSTFTAQFSTAFGCVANNNVTGFRIEVPSIRLDKCVAHNNTAYGIDISTASAIDTVLDDCDTTGNATANVRDLGTTTHAYNVRGWKTRNTVTIDLAIDSTGTKTGVIAHGLALTPNLNDCVLSLVRVTAVSDPGFAYLWCESTDGVNVTVRLRVSAASATVGAVVRVVCKIDVRP